MNWLTNETSKLSAAIAMLLLLGGCSTLPTGPNVRVLPGSDKSFEQFQYDDGLCRQWSEYQIGKSGREAAADSTITGAAVGTALGAATGAALGAAVGDPGSGAAVGAGFGLLGGTAAGAEHGAYAEWQLQGRYDTAYMQCMYAKGHQIPVRRSRGYPGETESSRAPIPPPPPGYPSPPVPPY